MVPFPKLQKCDTLRDISGLVTYNQADKATSSEVEIMQETRTYQERSRAFLVKPGKSLRQVTWFKRQKRAGVLLP